MKDLVAPSREVAKYKQVNIPPILSPFQGL